MIQPPFLVKGSTIALVSPSGKVNKESVLESIDCIHNEGYKTQLFPHVFNQDYKYAGTDQERLKDLQEALNDAEIDAIWCGRGGYGLIRILPMLDFSVFVKKPKWIIGFSDVTLLHQAIAQQNVQSIHGMMPNSMMKHTREAIQQSFSVLRGVSLGVQFHHVYNQTCQFEGEIVGGNLSILYSLLGTPYFPDLNHKILFIEEVSEHLYHIDRMIQSLYLSGKLTSLKGIVVGGFTDLLENKDTFGKRYEEILIDLANMLEVSIVFGAPFGHHLNNHSLVHGLNYRLKSKQQQAELIPLWQTTMI